MTRDLDSALDILLNGSTLTVYRAGLFTYRRWYNFPLRVFADWDLILVGQGRGVWQIEGLGACAVRPGTVMLIAPHVRNGTRGKVLGRSSLIGMHFDLRLESGADFFRTVPYQPVMQVRPWRGLFEQGRRVAAEWAGRGGPGRGILVHDLTRALLVELVRQYARRAGGQLTTDLRVLEVLRRLEEQYTRRLSVSQMGRWVGLSPAHLRELFHAHLGLSPHQVLASRRLRQARWLLLNTSMPVKQVAAEVGFEDPLYFSRAFRRATGTAPVEFRQSAKSP